MTGVTARSALAFVRRNGIVLESARGPMPNLAEFVAGGRIRGNWWGHAKGRDIFALTRAIRDSKDVLVCRLVDGKVTYVHRRLWAALVRLRDAFAPHALDAMEEVHTATGRHSLRIVPFDRWVPRQIQRRAHRLSENAARATMGQWLPRQGPSRRSLDPA